MPEGQEIFLRAEKFLPAGERKRACALRRAAYASGGLKGGTSSGAADNRQPDWRWYAAIAAAGLLARGLCLRATFQGDDLPALVEGLGRGAMETGGRRAVTRTLWIGMSAWAGVSGPALHALNLITHLLLSGLIYRAGREFFEALAPGRAGGAQNRRRAGLAALIFAAHPLGGEVCNYAIALSIALASLFAFMAGWMALRWALRGWRWAPAALAALILAAFSKDPGVFHAGINIGAVLAAAGTAARRRALRQRKWAAPAAGMAAVTLLWLSRDHYVFWCARAMERMSDSRFPWHLLTQSRVFWEYMWRALLPVKLCCDHQIAWTMSAGDAAAWLAALGVAVWLGAAVYWLARGRRLAGMLAALVLGHLLLRFPEVSNELMVEYRVYPSLPWIAMTLAWGLDALCRRSRKALPVGAALLVIVYAALSARRAHEWRSLETLCAGTLRQYPWQTRAMLDLQRAAFEAGRYKEVIARRPRIVETAKNIEHYNNHNPRGRQYDWGHMALWLIQSETYYARALGETQGARSGLAHMQRVFHFIFTNQLKDEIFWEHAYFGRGMLFAKAGNLQWALRDLSKAARLQPRKWSYKRERDAVRRRIRKKRWQQKEETNDSRIMNSWLQMPDLIKKQANSGGVVRPAPVIGQSD